MQLYFELLGHTVSEVSTIPEREIIGGRLEELGKFSHNLGISLVKTIVRGKNSMGEILDAYTYFKAFLHGSEEGRYPPSVVFEARGVLLNRVVTILGPLREQVENMIEETDSAVRLSAVVQKDLTRAAAHLLHFAPWWRKIFRSWNRVQQLQYFKTDLELAETCLTEIHTARVHFKELAFSLSSFAQSVLMAQERHITIPSFPELTFEDQTSMLVQVGSLEALLAQSRRTIDKVETSL